MSNTSIVTTADALSAALNALSPATFSLYSDDATLVAIAKQSSAGHCHSASPHPLGIELPATDLAVVDADIALPAEELTELLARLRDLLARQVLVIAPTQAQTTFNHAGLIGLGFQRWTSPGAEQPERRWYRFDIRDYKSTPDWLNARHWANPELWDKYRW
ncbi:MAG: DUF6231 family protein [Spiribacter sp.]|nr:DUF6231 family protein [Spiribacter sp.]MDR9480379.1 DUF6231 family protein [Spiribacter sp.]